MQYEVGFQPFSHLWSPKTIPVDVNKLVKQKVPFLCYLLLTP